MAADGTPYRSRCNQARHTGLSTPRRRSDGFVGEDLAELEEMLRRAAEGELQPLGPEVVAVQRVVTVDADAPMQVLGGGRHALAAVCEPELRRRHFGRRRKAVLQPPGRLPRREPD